MKTSIAITIAILVLMPTACGTSTITEVRWNANLKVIEILFDKFPAKWGGWTMYVDGNEWPMEGGPGKPIVRPNAAIGKAMGLFVGTDPWISGLEKVNFPCCGAIQFSIPGEGSTNTFHYNLVNQACKTVSPKSCIITLLPTDFYQMGPAGGPGGTDFDDSKNGIDLKTAEVKGISISFEDHITCIGMLWEEWPNSIRAHITQSSHGSACNVADRNLKVDLDSGEYITAIGGGYHGVLNYIDVYTNKRSKPESIGDYNFGEWTDTPFYFKAPDGYEIVGLHGRCGEYLDALGVWVRRLQKKGTSGKAMTLEKDTDRPGNNYRSYRFPESAEGLLQFCANDCANDPDCAAFTYVEPGFRGQDSLPECYLKKSAPNPVPQKGCYSGAKLP